MAFFFSLLAKTSQNFSFLIQKNPYRTFFHLIGSVITPVIKQIGLPLRSRLILLITHVSLYRSNWTPLSPITIINQSNIHTSGSLSN